MDAMKHGPVTYWYEAWVSTSGVKLCLWLAFVVMVLLSMVGGVFMHMPQGMFWHFMFDVFLVYPWMLGIMVLGYKHINQESVRFKDLFSMYHVGLYKRLGGLFVFSGLLRFCLPFRNAEALAPIETLMVLGWFLLLMWFQGLLTFLWMRMYLSGEGFGSALRWMGIKPWFFLGYLPAVLGGLILLGVFGALTLGVGLVWLLPFFYLIKPVFYRAYERGIGESI